MTDKIRNLMSGVIGDGDLLDIGYEFTGQTEKIWVNNPGVVADAIVRVLEQNGYQIVHKDELAKTGNISSDVSWYEDYRRGMSF